MEIRAAMVEYILASKGAHVRLVGDPEAVVHRARAYRKGARDANTLLVSLKKPDGKPIARRAGSPVLEWEETAEANSGESAEYASRLAACVEQTYDVLRSLDTWEAALKDSLLDGATLEEFMNLGRQMLTCPLAYFDRNLIVLAASSDYWEYTEPEGRDAASVAVEGQMPLNRAADLVEDTDYLLAARELNGFYYEDANHSIYYALNTFDDGEYLARLVLALPSGTSRLHRGEEQLVHCYHRYLDDLHLRFAGNARVVSSQNDALHSLVRKTALVAGPVDNGEAAAVLSACGWALEDDFMVAKLVFFEGVHWDSVSLYLCGILERLMDESCALPFNQHILWLVNLSKTARAGEMAQQVTQRFAESLVNLLRNYACKAGISDRFNEFGRIHDHVLEADYAIELGQTNDPHHWYYWFRDYSFDYLIARCAGDLPPELTCHPGLAALAAHDSRHGTEYARTLVCYLRNGQNTTHAANELFIHRTSFMRRMSQVHKIAHTDLSDPDQVLHVLLSAKMLGM